MRVEAISVPFVVNVHTKRRRGLDLRIFNVYTYRVDVLYQYGGLKFVWSADKAVWNILKHDVRFEQACQILFDPFVRLSDATADDEMRDGALGSTEDGELLFVVHLEREPEAIRIISARRATANERKSYEEYA
jgi:uncharacterized protein